LACLRSLRCLAAEAFWILLRRRVGLRFELGSVEIVSAYSSAMINKKSAEECIYHILPGLLTVPAILLLRQ
jgi:hypothetical protein